MIPGHRGPIVFPFKAIGQQVLTIDRNQLIHHNSHIAILAAKGNPGRPEIPNAEDTEETPAMASCPCDSVDTHQAPACVYCAGVQENEEQPVPVPVSLHSLSSVSVQLAHCTALPSNGKCEHSATIIVSTEQLSKPTTSQMHVSKLDANEYLQWQWEKLVNQLNELDIDYPDGSSTSMSELVGECASDSPLLISEGALRLYRKAKELGCPDWANQFLLLVGHRILTISKGPLFLGLDPADVCEVLCSDFLDVSSERNVFRAANRWLDNDPGTRAECTSSIMGCVRFALMSKEDLIKYVVTRRRLKEHILAMPPFQRSLTNGLIWLCMMDLGLEANYPEFQQPPRLHTELPQCASSCEAANGCPGSQPTHGLDRAPDCSGKNKNKKAAIQLSQVAIVEVNAGPSAGRRRGGKNGRFG